MQEKRKAAGLVMLSGRCEAYDTEGRFYGPYSGVSEATGRAYYEHGLNVTALPVVMPR